LASASACVRRARGRGSSNTNMAISPVTYNNFVEYGIDRHAVSPAISESVALGFLEVTRRGRAGNAEFRQPSLYRVTFQPTDRYDATHEWRRIDTIERAKQIKAIAREQANIREARRKRGFPPHWVFVFWPTRRGRSGRLWPWSLSGSLRPRRIYGLPWPVRRWSSDARQPPAAH
jgi:hypothetical protein